MQATPSKWSILQYVWILPLPSHQEILSACWSFEADNRPTFTGLADMLERLPKLNRRLSHPGHFWKTTEYVWLKQRVCSWSRVNHNHSKMFMICQNLLFHAMQAEWWVYYTYIMTDKYTHLHHKYQDSHWTLRGLKEGLLIVMCKYNLIKWFPVAQCWHFFLQKHPAPQRTFSSVWMGESRGASPQRHRHISPVRLQHSPHRSNDQSDFGSEAWNLLVNV